MISERQFQVHYFQCKLKELEFQLQELNEASEDETRAHASFIYDIIHDLKDEFQHVIVYGEKSLWPVNDAWNNYRKRFN